ncbi:rft protein [Ditylenchus destructor]|nr:rft protein [Ditylenchus destructor]
MQTSFLNVFKYNFSGQIVARICSFAINLYLIRHVDPSLMGFLFVRMTLLYNTIGFLSREPLRKTCLSPSLSVKESLHYALLSPLLYMVLSVIGYWLWWYLPFPELELTDRQYGNVILSFTFSALIEGIAEPVAILSLKLGENAHFAFAQALLTLLQKIIVFALLLVNTNALTAFCVAQVGASLFYTAVHFLKFWRHYSIIIRRSFTGSWISNFVSYASYEKKYLSLIGTLIFHSLLKQLITDGSSYVMAFTKILPLKIQAVYEAVERLASLVARIILTPMEESAAIYYSSNMRQSSVNKDVPKKILSNFVALLRLIIVLGIVVCVFGIPYSKIVVQFYGAELLTENDGASLLSLYAIYLLFMAINGIVECFAFASMDATKIFSHGAFLMVSSMIHIVSNVVLSYCIGAPGFIIANCLNTIFRIVYNWKHIKALGPSTSHIQISEFLPSFTLCVLLVLTFFLTTISYFLFGTAGGILHTIAHIAVGGMMFGFIGAYLYQVEDLFTPLLEKTD